MYPIDLSISVRFRIIGGFCRKHRMASPRINLRRRTFAVGRFPFGALFVRVGSELRIRHSVVYLLPSEADGPADPLKRCDTV